MSLFQVFIDKINQAKQNLTDLKYLAVYTNIYIV